MPKPQADKLEQLDIVLDKMLVSDEFRQQAAQSGLVSLRVAAMLMDRPQPQLSSAARHIIKQQMLASLTSDPDKLTQDASLEEVAALLANAEHPELAPSARSRILDRILDHVTQDSATEPSREHVMASRDEAATEPSRDNVVAEEEAASVLSPSAKGRMFERVLEAQQQLQINALVNSDEALALAKDNPDPIVQAAVRLRTAPVPSLSSESKARIRERILPTEEVQAKRILRPNFAASVQRVAASIAILLFVSLIAIPRASADSLPGDVLYPVKRSLENVSLQFAASDVARANVHLNHADERIEELDSLLAEGQYLPQVLDDAFASLEAANRLASQTDEMATNVVFRSNFSATLMSLEDILQDYSTHIDTAAVQAFAERQNALSISIIQVDSNTDDEQVIVTETVEATIVPTETTPEATEEIVVTEEATPESIVVASPEARDESVLLAVEEITLYANATAAVRVRSAPSISSAIIASIVHGDSVTQIAMSEDTQWIHVRLEDGQEGWIAAILLVNYPPATQADTASNGQANGTAASNPGNGANANGNANGSSNGNSTGNATGNSNGNATGNASGNSNGNTTGSSNGNASGNSNGNANGNSNGNANGNGN